MHTNITQNVKVYLIMYMWPVAGGTTIKCDKLCESTPFHA